MLLRPRDARDERWVVMTEQPRLCTGSLSFMEIPAGMLDDTGEFIGGAAMGIREETGIQIWEMELIDMTALALNESQVFRPSGCHVFQPRRFR
jgi:ADP-sugar diphosphatase